MPSTVIAAFRYLSEPQELEITFRTGRIYAYRKVSAETASAMKAAFSKGEFFNAHIRGRYAFERRNAPSSEQAT